MEGKVVRTLLLLRRGECRMRVGGYWSVDVIRFVYDISAFLALSTTYGLRASVDIRFIVD